MTSATWKTALSRFTSEYGMLFVLLLLCAYYSYATWGRQDPNGAGAGADLAAEIRDRFGPKARVLVVARDIPEDRAFAEAIRKPLADAGGRVTVVIGEPRAVRRAFERLAAAGERLDVIAGNSVTASWEVVAKRSGTPSLASAAIVQPGGYNWPSFLKADNLRNIAQQIAVIAILAVGMTLVIVTGGIDLSVGSLIALSAVVAALLIERLAGGTAAGALAMIGCCLGAIAMCGLVGWFNGCMVALYGIPPFIVTLSMMLVASGLAYRLAEGQSVYRLPEEFTWLGREAALFGVPNPVVLMVLLYAVAHVLMTRMTLGRYVYAVGGNREAARLSGVPVRRVLLFAYTASGALAGVGGVLMASQLQSGSPTYGQMYELYVIAAVVVGGASLQGGQGRILGTLIGALIIAVIRNGMNLTGVEPYTQQMVFGLVILGAVLLDTLKKRGWSLRPDPG